MLCNCGKIFGPQKIVGYQIIDNYFVNLNKKNIHNFKNLIFFELKNKLYLDFLNSDIMKII